MMGEKSKKRWCRHENSIRTGRNTKGFTVFICNDCGHVYTRMLGMIADEYHSVKEYMKVKREKEAKQLNMVNG